MIFIIRWSWQICHCIKCNVSWRILSKYPPHPVKRFLVRESSCLHVLAKDNSIKTKPTRWRWANGHMCVHRSWKRLSQHSRFVRLILDFFPLVKISRKKNREKDYIQFALKNILIFSRARSKSKLWIMEYRSLETKWKLNFLINKNASLV